MKTPATTCKTPRGLGSYVFISKPQKDDQGKEKYSVNLLFDKATANMGPLRAAILAAAMASPACIIKPGEKHTPKSKAEALLKAGALRNPIRDGDAKFLTDEEKHAIYKNRWFISCTSSRRVAVVDTDLQPVDPASIYSGCYFHAVVNCGFYDFNGNKGISTYLQGLMLVHRGPRIDGSVSVEKAFEGFTADTTGLDSLDAGGTEPADDGFGSFA